MPTTCVAYGCKIRGGTNKLSQVKFYKFPSCPERKRAWVAAVQRKDWQPSKHSTLCNRHFITGKPSKEPAHPDWIPSIFLHSPTSSKNNSHKLSRYTRLKAREVVRPRSLETTPQSDPMEIEESVNSLCSQWVQTDMSGNDIDEIISQNNSLRKQIAETAYTRSHLVSENLEKDSKKLKFFTGLPKYVLFQGLLMHCLTNWTPPSVSGLTFADQLLLTLMKLRLGLLYTDLAYRFQIRKQNASLIFSKWIAKLSLELKPLIRWPDQKSLLKSLPSVFKKEKFKKVRCIIDCSEIFLQRPTNLTRRSQTFSNYKHHNTIKVLIGITPNGTICFLSKCYGGRISDKELTIKSDFVELLSPGDIILADRGFLIRDVLSSKQVKLLVPTYTRGKPQLSRRDVETSRQLSRLRIHVERVIGQLKTFRILQGTVAMSMLKVCDENHCLMDKILIVCSALLNMLDPIVK